MTVGDAVRLRDGRGKNIAAADAVARDRGARTVADVAAGGGDNRTAKMEAIRPDVHLTKGEVVRPCVTGIEICEVL